MVQKGRHRRLSLQGVPVLFGNSFPKSGTHLLIQVLQGFTHIGPAVDSGLPAILTYEGATGRPRSLQTILKDLHRLRSGDVAYGHLHAFPEVVSLLCQHGSAPYFIYRDPRDVVVSHVYYVTDVAANHVHHQYYSRELKNFDERLQVSILGRPDAGVPFPNIRERFEPYLGWLDRLEVLSLRFEDFIKDRQATLERVFDHAVGRGFPASVTRETARRILDSAIDPARSPTFRSGKVGRWQEMFTDTHKSLFLEVAGDLLIRLAYERDNNW
jgi:hypothetical protein